MGDGTSEMQARRPGPFHKPHCKIGKVARDPLLSVKGFWDIGVRDATAIWIVHYVGREIRALDYCEAVRQPLAAHLEWLRTKGYGGAECFLPHDASHETPSPRSDSRTTSAPPALTSRRCQTRAKARP